MTDSSASTVAAPIKTPSFWEDVIDIFVSPADVFRRRQYASAWPPLLFVAIAIGVIFFVTFNTLQPIFDAEFSRGAAKAMAKNPQVTQEMMDKSRNMIETVSRYAIGIITLVTMFVVGCVTWLLGRVVGSRQSFQAAIVVAAWANMPRVLGAVINAVQGLLMDPAKLNSQLSISLSPARFLDPDTANPLLYQLLGRFDLITIWVTVLLAIGLYVTGKITKERAVIFGLLIWIVGALPALQQGFTRL
jgi:hypothetical protein